MVCARCTIILAPACHHDLQFGPRDAANTRDSRWRLSHMKIETILASKGTNVFTVRPDRSIKEALALLVQHNIGALIVVDDSGKPIGILSERDIIREAARNAAVLAQPVSRVMTQNVIVASPHDEITSVEQAMTYRRIR